METMHRRSWNADEAAEIIAANSRIPGALLPILHALQDAFGYVDESAVPVIADALNLSRAEVHGVITFYHDFRHVPAGRHVLRLCRAEACQSMGCDALIRHVEQRLGIELGRTTADGGITVEAVYCLGNCALSPAAMLDGKLHGRLSPASVDRLIDAARSRP
jgi:formate dehydrogenase subunit gamma